MYDVNLDPLLAAPKGMCGAWHTRALSVSTGIFPPSPHLFFFFSCLSWPGVIGFGADSPPADLTHLYFWFLAEGPLPRSLSIQSQLWIKQGY